MRNTLLVLPGIILAINSVVPAWAQGPDGFQLTSPLSLSAGYDGNFAVGSQVLDDTVTLLTLPTLSWTKTSHRTDFFVDYEPEFEIFSQHQELNAWNHTATLRLTHRINGRWTLEAGDSFLSTMDPTRVLVDSLLLLPRGRFRQNLFYAGLGYRLDRRTTLSFRFDNATATMALSGAMAGRLDQTSSAGTVTLDRTMNRHHALSGSYSYLLVRPLNMSLGSTTGLQNLNVGYIYTVNPGLIFRFAGGVIRGQQSDFTGGGVVEKRLSGLWVAAGFERYLSFFGGLAPTGATPAGAIPFAYGLAPGSLYEVASLRASGKLTKRIGVEGSALRAFNGVNPQDQAIKSVIGQLRLDYRLNERLTLFTRVDFYGQNVYDFSPLPMSRRRYFGGLEIALSRRREPRNSAHEPVDGPANSDDSTDSLEPLRQEER